MCNPSFNCLSENETIADLVARERICGIDIRLCYDQSPEDDEDTDITTTHYLGEATFQTVYAINERGMATAVHDFGFDERGIKEATDAVAEILRAINERKAASK